ncbi:4405_t:CDS:2, partial [Acaulospora morrowiae]
YTTNFSKTRRTIITTSQMEPGKKYRDPDLRLNDQEWLRMDEATDRLSTLAGLSTLQSLMDTISKGIMDRIMPFLPNKKKNTSNDDMDEITKGMIELSINKAIAKVDTIQPYKLLALSKFYKNGYLS